MRNPLIVQGAYGRSYADPQAAQKDWDAGKDFRAVRNGPYTSSREVRYIEEAGYDGVVGIWGKDHAGRKTLWQKGE